MESPIPSPTDVLFSTLRWIGVPALLLLPLAAALAVAEWLRFAAAVRRLATSARTGASLAIGSAMGHTVGKITVLTLAEAAVVATVYGSFRLAYAMSVPDSSGHSISSGRSFTWSELWVNIVTYNTDVDLAVNAALIALGWALAVDVCMIFRMGLPLAILTFVKWPVGGLAIFGAVGIGVVGLLVLSLATWMHNPQYNLEMVSLYAAWVVLLGLGAWALFATSRLSSELLSAARARSLATST